MKTRSKNSLRGFTLVELLVAMAITIIILTVLVSVTAMALDTWNRSRSEVRAARQAKAMIDSMARDLESFVSRKGNSFQWLYAKSEPPADGPKNQVSPNAVDLIFFSAATDRYDGKVGTIDDLGGDVSAVGYRLAYKDPIAGADVDNYKTFVLYRKIVNPDVTFADILGQANIKIPFDAANGVTIGEEENFVCENIYQFTVSFHVSMTKSDDTIASITLPVGLTADSTEEFKVMGTGIESTYPAIGDTTPNGFTIDEIQAGRLYAAEISITVLNDFGLEQMRRREFVAAGLKTAEEVKAEFIAKHSYQYSKIVQLPDT